MITYCNTHFLKKQNAIKPSKISAMINLQLVNPMARTIDNSDLV